jgi:hypothetical protein
MRTIAAILAAVLLGGCAHGDAGAIANTLFVASVIAIEVAVSNPAPSGPLCQDDPNDPPHTCPGTTPGPSTPPPAPPDP